MIGSTCRTSDGKTALMYAALLWGVVEILMIIVLQYGKTPLQFAEFNNHGDRQCLGDEKCFGDDDRKLWSYVMPTVLLNKG